MRSTSLGISLGLLLTLTSASAWAGFDEAAAAFAAGNYAQAQEQLQPLLANHDPRAQYSMGVLYENGFGVSKNPKEAAAWYLKSAEQGNSDAQFNLGAMHEHGVGIPVNFTEAARWYRPAAEVGDIDALSNLGVLYQNGQGVKPDKVLAMALYNVSVAYAGNAQTQAKQNRQALANQIPMAELQHSMALTEELLKPGNLKAGLRAYLQQGHSAGK
jgi:TPR repeat protein